MNMQARYKAAVENGLTADPAQERALPEFERLRSPLLRSPLSHKRLFPWGSRSASQKGLYLWGGVGRGKSMLMDMFVASLDVPVRRIHFHAFMQEIHTGMDAARKAGQRDAIAPVAQRITRDIKCLALDEMQILDIADAMIVGRLFEALFAAGVMIVTTSNRPPDDLYKDGLNRGLFLPFIALLKDRMVVHELAAVTDYRQNRLRGQKVWFAPLNPQTDHAMDALWLDLAGGQGKELILPVKGRTVVLPRFRNGIGRASFDHLCTNPYGPADYLAMAQAVSVLMIDHIPPLTPQNASATRRFITLIDALYEARVRLIVSAETGVEGLCTTSTHFEFARTTSRLQEMQGADWAKDMAGVK